MNKKNIIILVALFFWGLSVVYTSSAVDAATPAAQSSVGSITGNPAAGGSGGSTKFDNPLNAQNVQQILTNILGTLKGVVITISVIFIIIGGLMYMMSGGNETTITRAKACVGGAIIGLAIALAAPIFLNEILKIFGGASSSSGLNTSQIAGYPDLKTVVTRVLQLLLSVLGIIAIISLVAGGAMYLTSYGDEKRIETAKKIVKYAILGIVISLSAIVIVREVGNIIGTGGTSMPSSSGIPGMPNTNNMFPQGMPK